MTINQKVYFLAFILFLSFFFFLRLGLYLSLDILEISVDQVIIKLREIEPTEMCASTS